MTAEVAQDVPEPASRPAAAPREETAMRATDAILREITRGGLAGLIVGIALAGVGGRLVMRLAAMLVPDATGSFTENGNVVGSITLGGSVALVVFVGLLFGTVVGSLWVVIGPWLPSATWPRAMVAIPVALALGTHGLVDERNRDFAILDRDPLVIASLVALVALFGPALVLVERWLEDRLPRPRPGDGVVVGYTIVTAVGTLLMIFFVVPLYLGSDLRAAGAALVVVGLTTLISWWRRGTGRPSDGRLALVARAALVVAFVAGAWVTVGDVSGALGSA